MTIATQATLAALLAKTVATPATEAKQDTGNKSLAAFATQTSGLATAAAQSSGNTSLASILAAVQAATPAGSNTIGAVNLAVATATGSITSNGAVVDGATDVSGYASVRVALSNTFVATVQFQSSYDGTNWVGQYLENAGSGSLNNSTSANASGAQLFAGPLHGKFFRLTTSSFSSGTVDARIIYTTAPFQPVSIGLNGGIGSIVGGVYVGTAAAPSVFSTVTAASTNATNVKASGANLYELTVSNTSASTVYLKLYNKASAPTVGTDTPVAIFPIAATSTLEQIFGPNGKRFTTGLAWAMTGAMAATDTTAVGTGVIVHGSYA